MKKKQPALKLKKITQTQDKDGNNILRKEFEVDKKTKKISIDYNNRESIKNVLKYAAEGNIVLSSTQLKAMEILLNDSQEKVNDNDNFVFLFKEEIKRSNE